MKKHIINIALAMSLAATLAACYSDDSTLGDLSAVGDIEIAEMPAQSVISYAGNHLMVTPVIESTFGDADLEYAWYIYQEWKEEEDGFRTNCISRERNLDYEVNLASGTYTVALEVKSRSNGLAKLQSMTLNVKTQFADAFYILKETADGNTDLDIVASDGGLGEDIITNMYGTPVSGKPVNIAVLYGQNCIDPDTEEMTAINTVNVFTETNYESYRAEDMKKVFDKTTISYAGEENTANYRNIVNGYFAAFLVADNGVGAKAYGTDFGLSTGKYGLPAVEGNYSKHMQMLGQGGTGMAVWDNDNHGIYSIDYNCMYAMEIIDDPTSNETCIASGINRTGGTETVWYLTEDAAKAKRFLYLIDSNFGELIEKRPLDPSLHISNATCVAACGGSAAYIYAVDGGRLYGYGWENGTEAEISLPGISGNITFVTNQWLCDLYGGTYDFDNLIVAEQKGDTYSIFFYDSLVGGVPTDAPYMKAQGNGRIRAVRRTTPSAIGYFNVSVSGYSPMPIFPTSD